MIRRKTKGEQRVIEHVADLTVGEVIPAASDAAWYVDRLPKAQTSTEEIDAMTARLAELEERQQSIPARRAAALDARDWGDVRAIEDDERDLPDEIWQLRIDLAQARAAHLGAESRRVIDEGRAFLFERVERLRWLQEAARREYGYAVGAENICTGLFDSLASQAADARREVDRLFTARLNKDRPKINVTAPVAPVRDVATSAASQVRKLVIRGGRGSRAGDVIAVEQND